MSEPFTSVGSWGLRTPGLPLGSNENVREFTGVYPLKPGADVGKIARTFTEGWLPPNGFLEATAKLALIRSARWFVCKTQYFQGDSLFFISQFDGSLAKYFDDFVLNGKENLYGVWGQCIGCPDDTARNIVEYIARGQLATLVVYDASPDVSNNQLLRLVDWYDKTRAFQREVAKPGSSLETKVDNFLKSLGAQAPQIKNDAIIDTTRGVDGNSPQYDDVKERVLRS